MKCELCKDTGIVVDGVDEYGEPYEVACDCEMGQKVEEHHLEAVLCPTITEEDDPWLYHDEPPSDDDWL